MCSIDRIAKINDMFRSGYFMHLGKIVLSAGVVRLPEKDIHEIWRIVSEFDEFTQGNDPWGERDFGAFNYKGETYYWKIDYYNENLSAGSEDPTNPRVTTRVLTIMRSDEY